MPAHRITINDLSLPGFIWRGLDGGSGGSEERDAVQWGSSQYSTVMAHCEVWNLSFFQLSFIFNIILAMFAHEATAILQTRIHARNMRLGIPIRGNEPCLMRIRGGSTEAVIGDGPRFLSTPVETWIEENFPVQSRKEFGHACLGFGSCLIIFCLMPIPVVGCFLNRSGLLLGNILIFLGSVLVAGPRSVRRFLFCKSRRFGSLVMFIGVTLMWKRIVLLGLLVEILGVASLFGPFLDSFLGFLSPWVPRSLGAFLTLARKIVWAWSSPVLRLFTPAV
eukprot:754994-Hanusia_phi.AAC.6